MAAWMRSRGHEVTVIVGGEGPYVACLEEQGIPYWVSRYLRRSIHPIRDICAALELRGIFQNRKPDLIALHSAKAGLVGRFAAVGLGIPVVMTAHGWPFTEGVSERRAAVYRILERMAAPLADRIITVSDYDRSLAGSAGIGPSEKVVTIHNAIPDVLERQLSVGEEGPIRIVMVARLDEQKDHVTLLNALASLKEPNWTLDLVGDGPREGLVRAEAERLQILDRVRFLGLRRDVRQLLARSHISVLATHWEGFPLSILEAMRAGVPVVASAVGGIPEAIADGETGFLVPRNDVNELRERVEYLLNSPTERARLGTAGRRRFEERFRFDRMAEETLAVYEGSIRGGSCESA
jgi:glycosyltransferase involved in cell wall biosynthesis